MMDGLIACRGTPHSEPGPRLLNMRLSSPLRPFPSLTFAAVVGDWKHKIIDADLWVIVHRDGGGKTADRLGDAAYLNWASSVPRKSTKKKTSYQPVYWFFTEFYRSCKPMYRHHVPLASVIDFLPRFTCFFFTREKLDFRFRFSSTIVIVFLLGFYRVLSVFYVHVSPSRAVSKRHWLSTEVYLFFTREKLDFRFSFS